MTSSPGTARLRGALLALAMLAAPAAADDCGAAKARVTALRAELNQRDAALAAAAPGERDAAEAATARTRGSLERARHAWQDACAQSEARSRGLRAEQGPAAAEEPAAAQADEPTAAQSPEPAVPAGAASPEPSEPPATEPR